MSDPTTASAETATGTIALSIPNMPEREMQVLLRDTVATLVARFPEAAIRWTDGPTTASAETPPDSQAERASAGAPLDPDAIREEISGPHSVSGLMVSRLHHAAKRLIAEVERLRAAPVAAAAIPEDVRALILRDLRFHRDLAAECRAHGVGDFRIGRAEGIEELADDIDRRLSAPVVEPTPTDAPRDTLDP